MSERITLRKIRPNPLFEEWLQDLYNEAVEKNSKLKGMLKEALASISKYPLPLQTGAECAILQGFGKKLCLFIDQKLEVYNSLKNQETEEFPILKERSSNNLNLCEPNLSSNIDHSRDVNPKIKKRKHSSPNQDNDLKRKSLNSSKDLTQCRQSLELHDLKKSKVQAINITEDTKNACSDDNNIIQKKSMRNNFNPSYRSGSYAILLALLYHYDSHKDMENIFLTKDDLIEKAQPFCEESFIRPKPNTFYTAWSNMTKLVKKHLVIKVRKKKTEFKLSEEGIILARKLLDKNCDVPSTNDLINKEINNLYNSVVSEESGVIQINSEENEKKSAENYDAFIDFSVGSFDVVLLIDKQETSGSTKKNDPTVAQFKKYPDLKYEFRHLTVGDFTWIARHKVNKSQELVLPYIVERKRMDDLSASIKDGRFHEQKFRLKKCGIPNIFYLIENYGSNKHVGLPIQTLMQAVANTRIQDGFKVHVTESLNHSARFLAIMSKRLDLEYKDKSLTGRNQIPINTDLMTFTYFNKSSCKNKPLTVTNTFIKLLLQLKGVSVEKALAITNVYKSPRSLIVAYSKCSEKEGELLLSCLKHKQSSKKVGPALSKSIYQLFTNI